MDTYNSGEEEGAWEAYMSDNIKYPFKAKCIKKLKSTPLKLDEIVIVIGPSDINIKSYFVDMKYNGIRIAIPLHQIKPIKSNKNTRLAIRAYLERN